MTGAQVLHHGSLVAVEVEVDTPAWPHALPDVVALCREAARAAMADSVGDVVILLADDDTVADLNSRFRGRSGPTNVLSFPSGPGGGRHLGDIALALAVCQSEAVAQGKPLADHVRHLVVHGVLHLLGHDHEDDDEARIMEALEVSRLALMGVPDPYAVHRHG